MSDAGLLSCESLSATAGLTKPLLIIHSDNCALPDQAKRYFAIAPTDEKLHVRPDTPHVAFYDDPTAIDEAVTGVTDWFARHLGPGTQD